MKKLFILLFVLLFSFTLTACSEDMTIPNSIDDLNGLVDDLNAEDVALNSAIEDLQDDLGNLEDNVSDLEDVDADTQVIIDGILDDISDIEDQLAALDLLIGDNADAIAAIDLLVAALQGQVATLEELVDHLYVEKLPFLKQVEIILVHTNDVHGRVNDDAWSGTMGMATVKNIIDEIDSQYDNTWLISAGDIFHGTTFATLEEGESVLNVMNFVGYDLMVPGNHDFDYGMDRLLELEELANFPLITANIQYKADDSDFMNPYVIQDFDGVKVGFFGLTTPETLYKTHPDNVTELNFLDPIVQAQLMVDELTPLVDVIVLVAHIGLDESTDITTEDIANAVDGIDVIIDGHSHTMLPHGLMVNDTLIVSTGEYMKNLGVLSIVVQGGQVVAKNSMLISSDYAAELGYGADQDVQDYIDSIVAAQSIILDEVVGQTSVVLVGERDNVRTSETNLGDLITDSMLDVTGADIAITNGGGIRASIPVGNVTVGDIITVLPFGNIIVTKELTGQAIIDTLEYGTSSYPNSSGKFPHVAGITFDININNEDGARVENVMVDGVPIDPVATYVVATNDFLAAGGDGYVEFGLVPTAAEFGGLHEALTTKFVVGTDVVLPTMGRINVTNPPELFFSQYGEPDGGNCKFIEIYNPTSVEVDLSHYTIIKGGNGDTFEESTNIETLVGTLAPGAVLVIGNPACFDGTDTGSVDAGFPQTGIVYIASTVVGYINGDDALGLFKDGVLIDTIGLSGEDPGTFWAVGNGDLLGGTTLNEGMIRIPTAVNGSPNWAVAAMEWISIDDRDYTNVGSHTVTP